VQCPTKNIENATAKATTYKYLGIAVCFNAYFNFLFFKECPGAEETVRFRNSRVVKESVAYAQ